VKDLARSATTEMVLRALNRIPADLRQILRGLTDPQDKVNIAPQIVTTQRQGILPMQGATRLLRLALS
jgi:hypothetical protein